MARHRTFRWLAIAGIGFTMPAALPRPAAGHEAGAMRLVHDVHLTHTRMIVDGSRIVARIRFFRDDLEKALLQQKGAPATLPAGEALDSLVLAYVAPRFVITADGARLASRLVESGDEHDGQGQAMRWIMVELTAAKPVAKLSLRQTLLFDTYGDQQNVVTALRMPGSRRQSLYFVAGGSEEQPLNP